MTKRDIIICHDAEELARKASEQFVALAGAAIDRSGRFNRGTTWSCQKLSASEGSAMSGYNYESFGQCDIDAPDF